MWQWLVQYLNNAVVDAVAVLVVFSSNVQQAAYFLLFLLAAVAAAAAVVVACCCCLLLCQIIAKALESIYHFIRTVCINTVNKLFIHSETEAKSVFHVLFLLQFDLSSLLLLRLLYIVSSYVCMRTSVGKCNSSESNG